MAANPNYEQAGELKIGQVGIANLRVRTLDVEKLAEEMRDRVARAPKLFARAAVIVDFGGLPGTPAPAAMRLGPCTGFLSPARSTPTTEVTPPTTAPRR